MIIQLAGHISGYYRNNDTTKDKKNTKKIVNNEQENLSYACITINQPDDEK